jgi:ribosomal protein S9
MPADNTEQQYLDELAQYDNRKLILWQLAADGRDFVGVKHAAQEYGKGDAPIPEQVEAFVDDMTNGSEIRPEYDEGTDWDALEETHGQQADELLQSQDGNKAKTESEPEVTVPLETAQTAFLDLDIVIKQTGGGAETQNACTPLALARQKIEADEELGDETQEHVIGLLEEVSDERGVELETHSLMPHSGRDQH